MSFSRSEQETTVNYVADDELVRVWSSVPKHIHAMRKDRRFVEVAQGLDDKSEWAKFTIPASEWGPVVGARSRRNLTDEQRQALADRLRRVRSN